MQCGIAHAPEPPGLLHPKRLYRVGQVLAVIPLVKRRALGASTIVARTTKKAAGMVAPSGVWANFHSVIPGQPVRAEPNLEIVNPRFRVRARARPGMTM